MEYIYHYIYFAHTHLREKEILKILLWGRGSVNLTRYSFHTRAIFSVWGILE